MYEPLDTTKFLEGRNQWRKVLNNTWAHLATNSAIRGLDIVNLPPRDVSTWNESSWERFMAQLEVSSLVLWDGSKSMLGGTTWHYRLQATLRYLFLDHLQSLKVFNIKSPIDNLSQVRFSLHPYCSPWSLGNDGRPLLGALEELRLVDRVVDIDLLNFICSCNSKIRKLHLTNCVLLHIDEEWAREMAKGFGYEMMTWETVFDKLRCSASALEEFAVDYPVPIPLTSAEYLWSLENNGRYVPPAEERREVKRMREIETSRLFDYRLGMIFPDEPALPAEDKMIARFEDGADFAAYQRLIQVHLLVRASSRPACAQSAGTTMPSSIGSPRTSSRSTHASSAYAPGSHDARVTAASRLILLGKRNPR